MSSGIKFRCYPTKEQKLALSQWMGCQRLIYNAKVAENRYFRTFGRKSLSLAGTKLPVDQQYSQFKDKELTPYLYEVPSQILRNGATRFMGAYSRFWKGLAGRPAFKDKHGKQSVWITNELFQFKATGKSKKKQGKTIYEHKLMLGTGKYKIGELVFKAHDLYDMPATITISKQAGKWFVSFSYEKPGTEIPEREVIDNYTAMSEKDLDAITCGIDRGVATPLADSDGKNHDFSKTQKERMEKKEKRKKHYQKLMAKRKPASKRRKRSASKAAKCSAYSANVRNEFAHQTSRKLVNSGSEVFVFEDLKIKNMTKAPKPKQEENGNYIKNGARAKAGLNKAILDSAWGKTKLYTTYKAKRVNKLVIVVSPHCTSQECSKCSHTHPDNRIEQAVFVCQDCGFTANADINAATVIKWRGIKALRAGMITVKAKKSVMRLRKKETLGQELAKVMYGEKDVRRSVGLACGSQPSANRETPTTTAPVV